MKHLYTTGEVSRFLQVSPRTVASLIDKGFLKGHILAGTTHRRVKRSALIDFMRAKNLELPAELVAGPLATTNRTTAEMVANLKNFANQEPFDAALLPVDCLQIATAYETLELSLMERS